MERTKKTRESGVELLRIIAILGVIMIHFSDRALPVLSEIGGARLHLLLFLRSLSSPAVDIFLITTGYFMFNNNRRTLGKPFSLILQVSLFCELIYLVECAFSLYPLTVKHFVGQLIPDNYYATLFVVLYFISPYINIALLKLSEKGILKCTLILFFFFSIMSTLSLVFEEVTGKEYMGINTIGAWGSEQGFNIVNFALCYIIGATLRKVQLPKQFSNSQILCFLIIITTSLIFLWSIVNQYYFSADGMRSAYVYDNPLVIILGCLLFLLFKNLHFNSTIINSIAKCVFATFVIHNGIIMYFPIEEICNMRWYMLYVSFVIFSVGSLIISWFVINIYDKCFYKLFTRLNNYTIIDLDNELQNDKLLQRG